MKLTLMSDLHLEFWEDPRKLIDNIVELTPQSDIIALAGDIGVLAQNYDDIERLLILLTQKGKVIYTPGNHEYYGRKFECGEADLQQLRFNLRHTKDLVINTGQPEWVEIQGCYNILVGTMWFEKKDYTDYEKWCLADFKVKNLEHYIYKYNDDFMRMLEKTDKRNIIAISHHSPTYRSVGKKYIGSALNQFFCNNFDYLLEDKDVLLACHGHLHDAVDFRLGNTRVVSNPFGYPTEVSALWKPLTVEI